MNQTKNPGKTGNGQTGVSVRGVVGCGYSLPVCAVLLPSGGVFARLRVFFIAYGI